MKKNRGDLQDDRSLVPTIVQRQRTFSLSMLLGQSSEMENPVFANGMAILQLSLLFRETQLGVFPQVSVRMMVLYILNTWQNDRNEKVVKVNWRFTTVDARIKLKHLYSEIQLDSLQG